MKSVSRASTSAAILSCLLCLPFALLFALIALQIEPNFGLFQPLLHSPNPNKPDVVGSLIALGTFVLVVVACALNMLAARRAIQNGGLATANPANLILAVLTLAAIVFVIGAIIVDQYPCWIGVPNCD